MRLPRLRSGHSRPIAFADPAARLVACLCLLLPLAASAAPQTQKRIAPDLAPDADTLFLLRADAAKGALADLTGHFTPGVTGGTVVEDDQWGTCLRLGDGERNGITLKDDGKLSFAGGVTLDAWVYLEEPPAKGTLLALKVGSFAWDLANGKLNVGWMVFPTEEVFTTTPTQYKRYPLNSDTINGLMQVPVKKWVHLTVSYDEPLGAITTCIDGMVDRHRYRSFGSQRLQCDGHSPITLLGSARNCRIGALRLRAGRPRLAEPSLEVYLDQLPYQDRMMLTFDHLDPDLPLPIEATVVWEKPSGEASTFQTITLASHAKKSVLLDLLPNWKNTLHTVIVKANAAGRGVLSRSFQVANVKPAGPVRIAEDHTLSRDGRRFLPLMVYHAMPEDFPLLAELGFNITLNDFNLRQRAAGAGYQALLKESLDAAEKSRILLWSVANSHHNSLGSIFTAKSHPAALGWYGADEPWGDLTRLIDSYNTTKMLEPDLPILIVQNNYSRLQETAEGADIVGVDPYPIPNVSLRSVADATRAAVSAVSGRKPVWTVIPQYGAKIPSREELRCMAWLALAAGADGLGLYAWHDRTKDPNTGDIKGWYTREHPELVENLRAVFRELRALEPVLLTPAAARQPSLTPANPALHALVKEGNGKRYLLIANDSRRAEEATLTLGGGADADAPCLSDGGNNASLRIRQGEVPIKLPPLGAAVYDISGT